MYNLIFQLTLRIHYYYRQIIFIGPLMFKTGNNHYAKKISFYEMQILLYIVF